MGSQLEIPSPNADDGGPPGPSLTAEEALYFFTCDMLP